jgi:hypothetical protein
MGECQDHYRKGLLSSGEVSKYFEIKAEYKELVDKMVLKIRKYAKHNEESANKLMEEVLELEDNISKTLFNKGRGFQKAQLNLKTEMFRGHTITTMQEHSKVIIATLSAFDLIREPIPEQDIKITDSDINGSYRSYADKNYKWRLLV